MVAQKQRPLTGLGNRRCLGQDIDNREPVLGADRQIQTGHQWEVEGHVALVTGAEVGSGVLRPLVGLGEEHSVRKTCVDVTSQFLKERVRQRHVLGGGPLGLVEIRHGIEPQSVHAQL
jgi:hypothetical protein